MTTAAAALPMHSTLTIREDGTPHGYRLFPVPDGVRLVNTVRDFVVGWPVFGRLVCGDGIEVEGCSLVADPICVACVAEALEQAPVDSPGHTCKH